MKNQTTQQNWYEVLNYFGNPVSNIEYIIASNIQEAKSKLKSLGLKGQHTVKRVYNGGVRG